MRHITKDLAKDPILQSWYQSRHPNQSYQEIVNTIQAYLEQNHRVYTGFYNHQQIDSLWTSINPAKGFNTYLH